MITGSVGAGRVCWIMRNGESLQELLGVKVHVGREVAHWYVQRQDTP